MDFNNLNDAIHDVLRPYDSNLNNIRILLDRGVDPNMRYNNDGRGGLAGLTVGYTVLMWASIWGRIDIIELLLDNGADLNIKDGDGNTALIWASICGQTDVVRLLLDRGAKMNIQNNSGNTALMRLSGRTGNPYINIVLLLLDRGAQINIQNEDGENALTIASRLNNTDMVRLIEQHKASRNIQSRFRGNRIRTIRTLKAKQRLALSRHPLTDDLTEHIGEHLNRVLYNQEVTRRMKLEELANDSDSDSYEIEDDFFDDSDSDSDSDYGEEVFEAEHAFEPRAFEPEPEPEQVFDEVEPETDRQIIDDINDAYETGLQIDLKRHKLEDELEAKKQRASDSRHEKARSLRRDRMRSVLEPANEVKEEVEEPAEEVEKPDMDEVRRRRLSRFGKQKGSGQRSRRRYKSRRKYMY